MHSHLLSLVGVIDLMGGQSVRAIAGNRSRYQPVDSFWTFSGECVAIKGNALALANAYGCCGIDSLYVADLDGLQTAQCQWSLLQALFDDFDDKVYADIGLHDESDSEVWKRVAQLAMHFPQVTFVVATECATSPRPLGRLLQIVGAERVAISFDYRGGDWLSKSTDEATWVTQCIEHSVATVIGLDLAAVGTSAMQRTLELCRSLRPQVAQSRYVTGGGIRDASDADQLIAHGANELMVASWFMSPHRFATAE